MNSEEGKKQYTPRQIEKLISENRDLSGQVKRLIRTEYDLYNTQEELDIQLSLYRGLYETSKRITAVKDFAGVFAEMEKFIIDSLNFGGFVLFERKNEMFEIIQAGGFCGDTGLDSGAREELLVTDELLPLLSNRDGFFATESTLHPLLLENLKALCGFDTFVTHFLCLGDEKVPMYLLVVGNPAEQEFYSEIILDSGHMVSLGNLISLVEIVLNNQLYYQQLKEERELLEMKVNQRTDELNKAMEDLKVLNDKLEVYSFQDELTGLYNRRGFFVFGEKFLQMAQRQQKQILVLYFDLDKFKPINDRWGHREGDLALQKTAAILRSACRSYDIVGRLGGDEFVILFDNFNPDDFDSFLDRLQKLFDKYNESSGREYKLQMSYGHSIFSPPEDDGLSVDKLIERADKMLYAEKRKKKNAEQEQ